MRALLTTGDYVKSPTGEVKMVAVICHPALNIISIDEVTTGWTMHRSRLLVTDEERRKLKEYHEKLKEMELKLK